MRLEVNHVDAALPQGIEPGSRAGRVLKVCRGLMDEGAPVTLVSRDMVARIRAQMMEVPAEDFTTDRLPDGAQPYTGRAEVYISDSLLTAFKKKGAPAEELYTCLLYTSARHLGQGQQRLGSLHPSGCLAGGQRVQGGRGEHAGLHRPGHGLSLIHIS